jgi:hypothetical protein
VSEETVLTPNDSVISVVDPMRGDSALAAALATAIKEAQAVKEDDNGEERK